MFGSHLSIAGSMVNALDAARELKLDTVQVFTKNQQQWRVKPLDAAMVRDWRGRVDDLGWHGRIVAHASYLINLASPADALWMQSIGSMLVEIERCEQLGIPFLVHHPGAPGESGREAGLRRIAAAYAEVFKRTRGYRTVCCLENTAGGGSTLGRTFEELAALRAMIVDRTGDTARIAYCFDTCHAHAAGYDMAARGSARAALDRFDALCGLENLKAVHLNDSKGALGSRLDRHEHIGAGTIGKPRLSASGFAAVVNHPALAGIPKILETPKGSDDRGRNFDALNLARLKRLAERGDSSAAGRPSVRAAGRSAPRRAGRATKIVSRRPGPPRHHGKIR